MMFLIVVSLWLRGGFIAALTDRDTTSALFVQLKK